jgi:hypothetical protein
MKKIAVHIAHAAFLPERAATLERLRQQLAPQTDRVHVYRSEKREHASVWATRMYGAAAVEDADAAIFLNDDVEVSSYLVTAVEAMIEQRTSRMISLHTVHPLARGLAEAGQRWLSTYHVTGPGYVFRKGVARQVLDYYAAAPKGWTSKVNEDNVLIQFAFRHREPIWNSIPALVRHDVHVPSSLGYDDHPGRVSAVPWTDELFAGDVLGRPDYWASPVAFVETHWTPTETLLTTEIAVSLGMDPEMCWWCGERPFAIGSPKTGARMCVGCLYGAVGVVFNAAHEIAAAKGSRS